MKSKWEIKPYSIIITNMQMPGLSGVEVAEQL